MHRVVSTVWLGLCLVLHLPALAGEEGSKVEDSAAKAPELIPLEKIPPNEPGSLRFDVDCRGFSVEVNGKKRGLGPGSILDGVPPGEYEVRISCPGHNAWSGDVHVKPGDTTKVNPRLKAVAGFLEIECKVDGAEVFLGEDKVGETPILEPIVVRPGSHEVKVSKTGYPPFTAKVKIAAGSARKVKVKLNAVTGRLIVKSKPRMALVSVDDEPVGETPLAVPLTVGSHQVRITLDGYESQVAAVEISKGEPTPLQIALRRAAEPVVASDGSSTEAAGGLGPAPPPGQFQEQPDDTPIYREWWLWTGVAAVVVAAVVIPVAVTQSGGGDSRPGSASLGNRTLHLLGF